MVCCCSFSQGRNALNVQLPANQYGAVTVTDTEQLQEINVLGLYSRSGYNIWIVGM